MKQPRHMSFVEAATNVTVGYGLAVGTQIMIFPWFGLNPALHQNFAIAAIFTAIALVRSFVIRRGFERFRR